MKTTAIETERERERDQNESGKERTKYTTGSLSSVSLSCHQTKPFSLSPSLREGCVINSEAQIKQGSHVSQRKEVVDDDDDIPYHPSYYTGKEIPNPNSVIYISFVCLHAASVSSRD